METEDVLLVQTSMASTVPPRLPDLPLSLPQEGAIRIELEEGIPIFRASSVVQQRIASLLSQLQAAELTPQEQAELDAYEAIDDYLSFINRTLRNAYSL
jgi:hypothetical protein